MDYSESRIYKLSGELMKLAQKAVPEYSGKFSKKTFTQHQHLAVLCIKAKVRQRYREAEDILSNMPTVQSALGLKQVPDYSTMCRNMQHLKVKVFVVLLYLSACLMPCSGRASIDATGFDKRHSSTHYIKRCKMRLGSMKSTFIVDTNTLLVLAVNATVTRRHDTKIILPLVGKTAEGFSIKRLCADKGYDDKEVRDALRSMGIRPLVKHREFKGIDKAHNARMNKKDYNQRVKNECLNSRVKRKYDDTLYSKTFWRQYKELLIMCCVANVERRMDIMVVYWRISTELNICNCPLSITCENRPSHASAICL